MPLSIPPYNKTTHDIGKIGWGTNHTNKTNIQDAIDLLRKHGFSHPVLY